MKGIRKNKVIIVIIVISALAFLIVLGVFIFNKISSGSTGEEKTESTVTAQKMQFVDAHGQWYEFTPNDNVKKHDYDLSAFKNVDGKMTYSDGKYKSRAGIDVSEFNGDIDWNAVKNAGVEFAFIRIGGRGYGQSGNLYADKKFDDNYKGAKAAGLDVGCYFFSQAINEEEAKEEAKYVLDILKGRSLDLPIVYDPESILKDEARTDNVSGEQFTKNCVAFFDYIKNENNVSNYSYTTMIYCNMVWEAFMLDLVKLKDYDIWYADYEPLPQTPYHFSIWQYSESGTISGVTGNVDLNIQIIVEEII